MGANSKYFTWIVNISHDIILQVKASCNAEIVNLLNDAYRFLYSYNETISSSAMHTYYSALPFTPHNTCLYQLYKQETSHSITVLQGIPPTWTSCLSILPFGHFFVDGLCVSSDRTQLAVYGDSTIAILDAQTTAIQWDFDQHGYQPSLALSPSKSTLAIATSGCLTLVNTTTRSNQDTQMLSGGYVRAVAFSSQGQYLLLCINQSLHLHHGTNASELSVLSTDWTHTSIIFTRHDTQVISGSLAGYIHFFALSSNQLSEIQERRIFNETGVLGLILRHDGKRLASSGEDRTIRIYDLPSRSPIAILRWPEGRGSIRAIAYHPTEEELAVGQDKCVVLWREQGTPSDWMPFIHSYHRTQVTGIVYCENGTRMYTSTQSGTVKLWATTTTRVQDPPKHASGVTCCAFNNSTSLFSTGSDDMSIILWKLTTGDCLRTLLGHTKVITSLIFSDDGVLLASGSPDRTIIVWDVASGSLLHKLEGLGSYPDEVLGFSKDNAHLTTRINRGVFMWELKSGELVEQRDQHRGGYMANARTYGYGTMDSIFKDLIGWHYVAEMSPDERKNCVPRRRGESEGFRFRSPIDRAALLCQDGRVLILDISRVDPTRRWWY